MKSDPIFDPVVDPVREARHRISESVGHDPVRLVEYYLERQKKNPARLVAEPKSNESELEQVPVSALPI